MAETEKPETSRYNKNPFKMKKKKSFKSLVAKMEQLKETEQGKLKGGIAVINTNSFKLDENSGTCVNNGDCSGEDNSGTCMNFCDTK